MDTQALPIEREWTWKHGGTFVWAYQLTNPSDGTPLDLTGWKIAMDVRKQLGGGLIARLTSTDSFTVTALSGMIDLVVDPVIVNPILPGTYVAEILERDAAGRQTHRFSIVITVQGSVTVNV